VTIEEKGQLIVWTVLDGQRDVDSHIGLAHWGSVRLVRTMTMDLGVYMGIKDAALGGEANAFDVTFDPLDGSRVYIGTENGTVLHVSVQSADHRPNPRSYKPELDALSAAIRSLAFCPFGEGYMLAGSDDGTVRLHATTNERPLITWPGTVDGQPIVKLIWSTSRPCVFVVLDTASRVHLWDLGSGKVSRLKL
jgi:WD40 repeat protein